jgi:redox-sensitive bicupin YhaK (pirin superfamily)
VSDIRSVREILQAKPTIEGAGVHLKRVFGHQQVPRFDPFLLLDDFHSDVPADYIAGFPWHPHRGIETITYMLHGVIEHGDSMGNRGVIGAGDVQWMTAGSGIIHQEMPRGEQAGSGAGTEARGDRLLWGLQLWANLPADHKMMAPRYQEIRSADIPQVEMEGGILVRVICGGVGAIQGPVQDVIIEPEYLDVSVPPGSAFRRRAPRSHNVFAYVIAGNGFFYPEGSAVVGGESVVLFGEGDEIMVTCGDEPLRFLLISGRPLGEPVAWEGPIVMNTRDELQQAFREYHDGTFIKADAAT